MLTNETKFGQSSEEVDGRIVFTVPGNSADFEWKLTPGASALLWTDSDYDVLENCQEIRFDDKHISIDPSGQITTTDQITTTKTPTDQPATTEEFYPQQEAAGEPTVAITALQEGATLVRISDYLPATTDAPPVVTKAWAGHGEVKILPDGNLSYLPDADNHSVDNITFIVHDGHWSTQVMKIRIENQVPLKELASQLIPNQFDGMDTYVNLDIGGYLSDLLVDGNVAITVAGLPPGLSYNDARMHIEGTLSSDGADGTTHTVDVTISTTAGQVMTTQFKWIIQQEKAIDAREAVTRALPPMSSQGDAAAAAVLYSVASQAALAARGFSLNQHIATPQGNAVQKVDALDIAKAGVLTGGEGQNTVVGSEADHLFDLQVAAPAVGGEAEEKAKQELSKAGASVDLNRNGSVSQPNAASQSAVDLDQEVVTDIGTTGPSAANEAPFAGTPPVVGTPEDVAFSGINVLAAAYDPEGDTLAITEATASHGAVSINIDGTLDYVPDANFFGADVVTYTISDGNGNLTEGSLAINVTPVNDAPVAGAVPAGVTAEDTALNNIDVLSAASDIDGDTLSIASASAVNGIVTINPDNTLNYVPDADFNGPDTITYTISDGNGGADIGTYDVTINPVNDAPRPLADSGTVVEDTAIIIDVLANDVDIDGTLDPASVQITGTASPGDSLMVAGEGTWSVNTVSGQITFVPLPDYDGSVTAITYSVADDLGARSAPVAISVSITPVNDAPVASPDNSNVLEDGSVVINVLANDTDIDGTLDPSSVQIIGTAAAGDPLIVAGEGTWSVNTATGEITFTPIADYDGTVSDISYQVRDDSGAFSNPATISVSLTPVNDIPVGAPDSDIVNEDGSVIIDVLANDTDIDGTLDPASVHITGTASPGDTLIVPGQGSWSVNTATGEITFTPRPDYNGPVTDITYTVSDDVGAVSSPVSVSVSIIDINDAPTALADSDSVAEDGAVIIDVLANDADIDGTLIPASVQITGTASPGDPLVVAGEGTWSVNTITGEITFTPEADYDGPVTDITYTVADDDGAISNPATVSVTITGSNDAPVAGAIPDANTAEDTNLNNIDVLSFVTDADGDIVSVTGASASNGSVSVNGDGTLNYIPNANYNGADTITFTLDDGNGGITVASLDIIVAPVNDNPDAGSPPLSNSNEDTALNNIDVLSFASDIDGDSLSVSAASAGNGTVSINPDGTLNYLPDPDYNGLDTISYTVDDGNGGTAAGTKFIFVSAINDPPVAGADSDSVSEDGSVAINVLGNDSDIDGTLKPASVQIGGTASAGDPLVVPGEGTWTINTATGEITFTPEADYNGPVTDITYTVQDNSGAVSNPATVSVSITPVNDAPVAVADSDNVLEDGSVVIDVLANDSDLDGTLEPSTVQITGTSNPGDPLVVPGQGTWSVNTTTGEITFIPEPDYDGSVTDITYTVQDNLGGTSNTAAVSVTITSVNDVPVIDLSDSVDLIVNGTFTNGKKTDWNGWIESGSFDNGGIGSNSPAVTDDADGVVATLTQSGLSGLSSGPGANGAALVTFDFGWSDHDPGHGSESQQLTLSVAGVDYVQITTPNGAGAFATVTYLNGATGPGTPIPSSESGKWDHYDVTVNLPASVADTGDILFTWTNLNGTGGHPDESTIDNVKVLIDDPVSTNLDNQLDYTAKDPAIQLLGDGASITDADGTTLQSARVVLTNAESNDQLLVDGVVTSNGASGTVNGLAWTATIVGVTVQIDITGAATHADYLTALALVSYENTDKKPTESVRTIDITVNDGIDESPVAQALVSVGVDVEVPNLTDDTGSGFEDIPLVIDVLANDLPGDEPIDPSTVQLGETLNPGDPHIVPGEGTWSVNTTTGEITFTPEANYFGSPTPISYTVSDTNGISSVLAAVTATIASVNDAPISVGESDTVVEDGSVVIDVLANDTDIDGTLVPATVQITGTASAGDPLVVPGQGTWSVNTLTGEITFTPEADYDGIVTDITYTVQDNLGATSNPATVSASITSVNDAPDLDLNSVTGGIDSSASFTEDGGSISITSSNVVALDDNDSIASITVTLDALLDGSSEQITINSPTISLASDNSGMTTLGSGLQITYTYTAATRELVLTNFAGPSDPLSAANVEEAIESLSYNNTSQDPTGGTRRFTIVLEDTLGLTSPPADAVVAITPVNDAPITMADSDSVIEDGSVVIDVLANDSEIDGTLVPSTVQIVGTASAGDPLVVPGEGTWTVNTLTGEITFTPEADYDGAVNDITYTVLDNSGATSSPATVSLTVIPANDAPTDIQALGNTGVSINTEGGNAAYFSATDNDALFSGRTELTVETQFSFETPLSDGTSAALFNYHTATGSDDFEVRVTYNSWLSPSTRLHIEIGTDTFTVSSYDFTRLMDGGQHTLSMTWDNTAGNWEIFVDGFSVASGSGMAAGETLGSGGAFVLGQDQDSVNGGFAPAEHFSGTYYDLRIFDDIRTVTEITAGANTTLPATEPNMVANWQFNDGETSTVTDVVSGNNLNLNQASGTGFTASTAQSVLSIAEDAASGAEVGKFTTTDPDNGDTFSYALTSDPSGFFEILGESLRLKSGATLDYETATSHMVTVEVTDSGGATYSENLTVEVTNASELTSGRAIWSDNTNEALTSAWDGTSFGSTDVTQDLGNEYKVMQAAEAPTRDEIIVVGVNSSYDVVSQIWNGSTWTQIPIGYMGWVNENYWWGAEVAYEQSSGDAVLVWNDASKSSGDQLQFATWDGTSWSAIQTVTAWTGDEPQHMKLASHPSSDEMVLIVNDSAADDYALVWNGSSWGNQTLLDTSGGSESDQPGISVSYESDSGDAVVFYNKNGVDYVYAREWDGSSWGAEISMTEPAGVFGEPRWTVTASDMGSDKIVVGVSTTSDEGWVGIWNGTSFEPSFQISGDMAANDAPNIAVAFEGQSGEAIVVYGKGTANTFFYRTWSEGSGWSAEFTGADLGADLNSMTLDSHPYSDQIMLSVQDDNSDLHQVLWNGSSWEPAVEMGTNTGEIKNQPFAFVWDQDGALPVSPIAFDLNGDGEINVTGETTAKDKSSIEWIGETVWFDMDGDDDLEAIEWLDGTGDALLVDNRDGLAAVDMDGTRLFGDQGGTYEHGYEQLEELDTNVDGAISGEELQGLNLWADDGDARVEEGELFTLEEMGISEIQLALQEGATDDQGRDLFRSSATRTDGNSIVTEDVWFAMEQDEGDASNPDLALNQPQQDLPG